MTLILRELPVVRLLSRASLPVVLGMTIGLSSTAASADEDSRSKNENIDLATKNEIIDLMLCYGTGTDTFGEPGNPNAFDDGLKIYQGCFTEDAVFNLWPVGADFNAPAPVTVPGPVAWAQFVVDPAVPRDPATGLSISHGQHTLTNFIVKTRGTKGTLKAYLNATRTYFEPGSGAVTRVAVANGTYTLYVERIRGKWLVKRLDLKLISFVDHFNAS
jgi:hypothetical protein